MLKSKVDLSQSEKPVPAQFRYYYLRLLEQLKDDINAAYRIFDYLHPLLLAIAQGINDRRKEDSFYAWLAGQIREGTPAQAAAGKYIKEQVGLSSIDLRDGGNSPNSASDFAEQLLKESEEAGTLEPPAGMPAPQKLELSALPKYEDLQRLIPKGYEFLAALGRTLVFRNQDKDSYLAIKLLKEGEDPALLDYESQMFDYVNKHYREFGLKGMYPSSYQIDGQRVVRVKAINGKPKQELSKQVDKDGSGFKLDTRGGYYIFMAYQAEGEGYFRYLSDASLSQKEFRDGLSKNIQDLFSLARYGIIHTALIELFHNLIQRGRQDRGLYLWMVDIIRPMGTRSGAGRLHAWTNVVRYPNMRLSGIADFPDFYLLKDLAAEGNPASRHMATLKGEHPAYNTEVFYLASYLGDYLLSAALVAGRYLRDSQKLDWRKPAELAAIMRECYVSAFCAFTGRQREEILALAEMIDWDRLAMQMALFMAEGDGYADYLLKNKLPEEIYGKNVPISYADNYPSSRGWVDTQKRKGWYFDGVNPDLGPVNGPNPLQELIKANYLFAASMINQKLLGSYIVGIAEERDAGSSLLSGGQAGIVSPQATAPQATNQGGMGGIDASFRSASTPLTSGDKGGIDFRALPIVTQAVSNLSANLRDTPLRGQPLIKIDLDKEWQEIERMLSSGITPSTERLKDYLEASCAKGEVGQDRDKVISCISEILRQQEETCCLTEATLRDILVVLEASRSEQQLKEVFLGNG